MAQICSFLFHSEGSVSLGCLSLLLPPGSHYVKEALDRKSYKLNREDRQRLK